MGMRALALGGACGVLLLSAGARAQDAPKPKPLDPGSWVTNDDYPIGALAAGEKGTVAFTLDISAAGAVTGCKVTQSSGSAQLDEKTCALLGERARFEPAHAANGRAVASTFKSRFHWELPDASTAFQPLISRRLVMTLDLGADGKVTGCEATALVPDTPHPTVPTDLCEPFRAENFSWVARGKPVRAIFTDEVRVVGSELALVAEQPGFEPLFRDVVRFEVDAEGRPINCKTVEDVGSTPISNPCTADLPPWGKPETPPATVYISKTGVVNRNPGGK